MLDKLKHWLAGDGLRVRAKARTFGPRGARPRLPARAQELPCPHCGEPMLAAWGTTCGSCRPGIASPKTANLSSRVRPGGDPERGLALGWLVVVRSPDERRRGTLIELAMPVSVLSRGFRPVAGQEWFDFADEFMSSGHALIARPVGDQRDGCFSIRDRHEPGPSANGTFVDSRRLAAGESVDLSEGDVIRVGATELVFKSLWLPPGDPRPA